MTANARSRNLRTRGGAVTLRCSKPVWSGRLHNSTWHFLGHVPTNLSHSRNFPESILTQGPWIRHWGRLFCLLFVRRAGTAANNKWSSAACKAGSPSVMRVRLHHFRLNNWIYKQANKYPSLGATFTAGWMSSRWMARGSLGLPSEEQKTPPKNEKTNLYPYVSDLAYHSRATETAQSTTLCQIHC